VKNVLAKLGAHSRLQLAALASREGLLMDQVMAADAAPLADEPVNRPHGRSMLEGETRARRGK
jgi:hypothetical protein